MTETTPQDDLTALNNARKSGKKVVFTNGCFDLLHIGHLRYLEQAKSYGDILVIGLNSDQSVRKLKGDSRPIIVEESRREILLALKAVDFVFLFSEDTPLELIKEIKPDVLVKGGDWKPEQIVGYNFVKSYGGQIHSLMFVEGYSTSNIIKKIKEVG
jgi:rfaE bifunctional protein nucleotidyltransferase chain/domain